MQIHVYLYITFTLRKIFKRTRHCIHFFHISYISWIDLYHLGLFVYVLYYTVVIVNISSDLSLQHHVSNMSATSFYWLRHLRRVRRSLNSWVSGYICSRIRHGKALQYLVDCCTPVTDVVGRQRLRSATRQMMVMPRHRLSTVGRQAFTMQGPMVWNSLPDDLRAQQDYESFRQRLKPGFFSSY